MAKFLNRNAAESSSDKNYKTSSGFTYNNKNLSVNSSCGNIEEMITLRNPIVVLNDVETSRASIKRVLLQNEVISEEQRVTKKTKEEKSDSDNEYDEFVCKEENSGSSELEDLETKTSSKRLRWTSPEKHAAKRYFADDINRGEAPTIEKCKESIKFCPELKRRTAQKVKSWVTYYINKKNSAVIPLRNTWTTTEKDRVRSLFANILDRGGYPSSYQMQQAIEKYPELKQRTVETMRSFIQYELKNRKNKLFLTVVPLRNRWTTAEKHRVRSLFAKILDRGGYPSGYQMQQAIEKYPELKHRTVETMRSFIQHELKIRKDKQN